MGKHDKLIAKVLRGTSDGNIAFDDVRGMLRHLGFDERIRGSHHLYRREGVEEKINVQRAGNSQAISSKTDSRNTTEISFSR